MRRRALDGRASFEDGEERHSSALRRRERDEAEEERGVGSFDESKISVFKSRTR